MTEIQESTIQTVARELELSASPEYGLIVPGTVQVAENVITFSFGAPVDGGIAAGELIVGRNGEIFFMRQCFTLAEWLRREREERLDAQEWGGEHTLFL